MLKLSQKPGFLPLTDAKAGILLETRFLSRRDRRSRGEVVYLEFPLVPTEHPWMKHAGMYENDPLFDHVLAEIAAYRQALDAEREELAASE